MTVIYNTFADWEDNFFVQDLNAGLPLTAEQKKFSILGIILDSENDIESCVNLVKMGIDAHVYGIIIDSHFLNKKKEKLAEIIELLKKFEYMDTESYEFRLGYFRNWQFGDLGWVLEKTMYQSGKYRRVCKPLDYNSLAETLSVIPVKPYEGKYDEISYKNVVKEFADLANKEVFKFL